MFAGTEQSPNPGILNVNTELNEPLMLIVPLNLALKVAVEFPPDNAIEGAVVTTGEVVLSVV